MSRALLLIGWFGVSALVPAADPPPGPAPREAAKPTDPLADVLTKLNKPVGGITNLGQVPSLDAILTQLSQITEVTFLINDRAFPPDFKAGEMRLSGGSIPAGVRAEQALRIVLDSAGAGGSRLGYLVRPGYVEIVPASELEKFYSPARPRGDDRPRPEVVPLTSAVLADEPLNTALTRLLGASDQTVVVSPKVGDKSRAPVSARLLNVPFDTAVELLAEQAGLVVIRRDRAYLVTVPESAAAASTSVRTLTAGK